MRSKYNKEELCTECNIATLSKRRDIHLLLYMHKQSSKKNLLKASFFAI